MVFVCDNKNISATSALFVFCIAVILFGYGFTPKEKQPNPFTGQWKVAGYMHRNGFQTMLNVEMNKVIYDFATDSTGTISRNDTITSTFSWSRRKKLVTIDDDKGTHVYRFITGDSSLELQDQGSGFDERGNRFTPGTWGIAFLRYP